MHKFSQFTYDSINSLWWSVSFFLFSTQTFLPFFSLRCTRYDDNVRRLCMCCCEQLNGSSSENWVTHNISQNDSQPPCVSETSVWIMWNGDTKTLETFVMCATAVHACACVYEMVNVNNFGLFVWRNEPKRDRTSDGRAKCYDNGIDGAPHRFGLIHYSSAFLFDSIQRMVVTHGWCSA